MNAHPAGPLHAGVLPPAETAGPRPPTRGRARRAGPRGVAARRRAAAPTASSRWPASTSATSPSGTARRCSSSTRPTSGPARPSSPPRSARASVHYAAKAFLCTEVARWVADEGLSLDVCSGGELAVALRAGFPAERIALHGNNKSVDELVAAVEAGVGRVVLDSLHEIARLDAVARERGVTVPVMVRLTVGVEAHTHEFIATAHEDQKFGFSIAGRDDERRGRGGPPGAQGRRADAGRAAQPHRQPDLRHRGLRGGRAPRRRGSSRSCTASTAPTPLADARTPWTSAAASASPTGPATTPLDVPRPGRRAARDRRARVRGGGAGRRRAIAVEPGRAIAGPGTVTLYEVGTLKDVPLGGGTARRYVSVDGGMSDNIRTALYDAEYDCRLVSRGRSGDGDGEARCRGWSASTASRGDIVVRDCWLPADLAPGRPAGGGRHRRVLLLDGQLATTGCRGPRSSPCATARRGCSCAARPSTTSSAWRWESAMRRQRGPSRSASPCSAAAPSAAGRAAAARAGRRAGRAGRAPASSWSGWPCAARTGTRSWATW